MTLKTKIHYYRFDTSNPEEKREYDALRTKLTDGRHWMNCLASQNEYGYSHAAGVENIELETKFLFSNQWNSTTARVFDWYEPIFDNRRIKAGHWLEITDEMREIRRTTLV